MKRKRQKNAPQRRKKSAAARLRPFWIAIALVLIAAGAGVYYAASWPGFEPKNIRVAGNAVVPSSEIIAQAAIAPTQNLWLQNRHAAERRIDTIPYILTARIHRAPPARVTIAVTERRPYATVASGDDRLLVDHDLRVLSAETTPSAASLPMFVPKKRVTAPPGVFLKSLTLRQMRHDYDVLLSRHVIVARLAYDRFGDLDATTRSGIRVLFGDGADFTKAIPLVNPILSQLAQTGRPIQAIDLRAPSTPVVIYKK